MNPTPANELGPVRRQLHRTRPIEPFADWDGLARRRAADPELAADSSWMVLPYGEVSVHRSLGTVRKDDPGWAGHRDSDGQTGRLFRTRAAAAEWVASP
jgi:hypothetical protein